MYVYDQRSDRAVTQLYFWAIYNIINAQYN